METMDFSKVTEEEQYRIVAAVAYAANREFSKIVGGKPFNPPWEEYPEDLKLNLIQAVRNTMKQKIVSAKLSHLQWVKDRLDMGYEKGENINWKKKTHPDLVPFEELPMPAQLKSVLFLAIVNSLGGALGYRPFDMQPITEDDAKKFHATMDELEILSTAEKVKPEGPFEGDPDAALKEALAKPKAQEFIQASEPPDDGDIHHVPIPPAGSDLEPVEPARPEDLDTMKAPKPGSTSDALLGENAGSGEVIEKPADDTTDAAALIDEQVEPVIDGPIKIEFLGGTHSDQAKAASEDVSDAVPDTVIEEKSEEQPAPKPDPKAKKPVAKKK